MLSWVGIVAPILQSRAGMLISGCCFALLTQASQYQVFHATRLVTTSCRVEVEDIDDQGILLPLFEDTSFHAVFCQCLRYQALLTGAFFFFASSRVGRPQSVSR